MKLSVHLLMDKTDLPDTYESDGRQFVVGPTPPRELLVPDFGIRVAANSTYLPAIGLDPEWSRALAHDGLVRGMTGSHALHVELRQPLPMLLTELLARYSSARYRADAPLLDIIRAVPSRSNVVAQLDLTLGHRVKAGLNVGLREPELRHRGEFYVFAENHWFLVDRLLLAGLEGKLAAIPDVTGEIALQPCIPLAHHADLLTRDMDLVFTTQSFARASATAKRYREWPHCREELTGLHDANWPDCPAGEPRFVYALDPPGALPFLTKVNLLHHVTRIRRRGFEVGFARRPVPTCSLPSPRTEGLPLRNPH
ncbi:hypothetical protein [Kibdelosporangium phytohabitans]|uniref:Uncharacterized protein n=1 Tax=Kibdelosporangium phytohabitans TaxID=860235 RepID=A0A0N9HUH0_9PSEU|nr:hypothetical protein [Kibdelosporangium phytohabitans]ALG06571.1 hypothetical protein AOZ06_06195 [Kibdelosporangium phytohabitans]MBE1467761.1 hypothetical protein [Kibdelosporangium phytohabitans]